MQNASTDATLPLGGAIIDGAHLLPVRVYWEDTDAGGLLYHASHIRFMERGRTEMLRAVGLDQDSLRDTHGMLFVVAKIEINYRAPGRFDRLLTVRTDIEKTRSASLILSQTLLDGDMVLADATVRCVSVNSEMQPCAPPDAVRVALMPLCRAETPGRA